MKHLLLTIAILVIFSVSPLLAADHHLLFLSGGEGLLNDMPLAPDFSNRAEMIKKLKKTAESSLADFEKIKGNTKILRLWWSVNAVLVEGDIEPLRGARGVSHIIEDFMVYPDEPIEGSNGKIAEGQVYTYGLKNMRVPEVWQDFHTKGKGVLVGIIDSGIAGNHPEFAEFVAQSRIKWNDFTSDPSFDMTDEHGHGSHVAGTIAGGNKSGTWIGVAPECDLIIAKAIGRSGSRTSVLLDAMEWMLDPDGKPETHDFPRVVNCSWHSGYGDQTPYYAMLERWLELGIIPCFSAGNSGPSASTITKPKEYPGVFASAAIDEQQNIASFSSRGPANFQGQISDKPDWANSGVDVYSVKSYGGYTKKSGTSMASPHTTGLVALMLSVRPQLSVEDVRLILKNSCIDKGTPGYDHTYGFGCLDAYRAVSLAQGGSFILGSVKTADAPLQAEITILENGTTTQCDAQGKFQLMSAPGTWTLQVSCFGYKSTKTKVTIADGIDQSVDITMQSAAKINLLGKVTAAGTTNSVPATISVVNHPELTATCSIDGQFTLPIPQGIHQLKITAFGFKTLLLPEKEFLTTQTMDFELETLPPVLLVDHDGNKDCETYILKSLEHLDIDYNHQVAAVTADQLMPYRVVIWVTGANSKNCISTEEKNCIRNYLSSGGSLFITGQEVAYALKSDKDFLENVLHAVYIKDKAASLKITSEELGDFVIEGGDGANNQRYPDVIAPAKGGKLLASYSTNQEGAAVFFSDDKIQGRVFYFGFGIEAISTIKQRHTVLEKVLNLLKGKTTNLSSDLSNLSNLQQAISRLFLLKENQKKWSVTDSTIKIWQNKLAELTQKLTLEEIAILTEKERDCCQEVRSVILHKMKK